MGTLFSGLGLFSQQTLAETLPEFLSDTSFDASRTSSSLRLNSAGQDWYESRNNVPTLLFLDKNDIAGNSGNKAGFKGSTSGDAYLSQEFTVPQTGIFTAQWDVYISSILDISQPDRAALMMIGTNPGDGGPCSTDASRLVYISFYKNHGGTSGSMNLVGMTSFNSYTTIATGLSLKQWWCATSKQKRMMFMLTTYTRLDLVEGLDSLGKRLLTLAFLS
jgi:hypothetical protein